MRNANQMPATSANCILMAMFALGFASIPCSGQRPVTPQSVNEPVDHQFTGIDSALTSKADELIVAGAQPQVATHDNREAASATKPAPTAGMSPASPAPSSAGLSAARARVNSLRPTIEPILREEGVPVEMSSIVLIESGGRPAALSAKGALGLWQLMPETARRYGLIVTRKEDERLNTEKSTQAAARYLHDLYAQFGDWKLALAAYSTGEANLSALILRAHTQDFDRLVTLQLLPLETRRYVPEVLAAMEQVPNNTVESNLLRKKPGAASQLAFATTAGVD